jgi:hypothetical protein
MALMVTAKVIVTLAVTVIIIEPVKETITVTVTVMEVITIVTATRVQTGKLEIKQEKRLPIKLSKK